MSVISKHLPRLGEEADRLKREARCAYMELDKILSRVDCGRALLREISPDFRRAEQRYREAMLRLRNIDPGFPYQGEPFPYERD